MKTKDISFIIPVYNRPDEVKELLESFTKLNGDKSFEIVLVEDGSTISSKPIANTYKSILNISYFFKENSGPGSSRNYGMRSARGDYFIILDSDCILPPNYLVIVLERLNRDYIDCFGGPDSAHESFTSLQKAINFSMTSFITTGGIRGKKSSIDKFQPRSFNMGISKKAFEATNGFGQIHPGEDPDLSIRLNKLGFQTVLISEAYVYHKRRISWSKFYKQVYKFGMTRPILNSWYPETRKITYWFPSIFILGLVCSIILFGLGFKYALILYGAYFALSFILSLISTKELTVALLSIIAIIIQFFGYGYGFLKSTFKLSISNIKAEDQFPELFFKDNK
ncbi:glycosyltransferase [Flavobacteriaceae bacterium AU392]|nr:glycosyltransferase [Flavobacteriaceae bacterium]RKM86100.1 glycosyltransferase [Flavobacteriaceae bacterium AU392]